MFLHYMQHIDFILSGGNVHQELLEVFLPIYRVIASRDQENLHGVEIAERAYCVPPAYEKIQSDPFL